MTEIIPVVMAGGSGTRLWPLSRKLFPKQFLPLMSQQSMFQETIARTGVSQESDSVVEGLNIGDPIIVFNDDEVLDYKMAPCCNAIPGDLIFGFLTVVDGIKVHRSDCPNAIQLRSNYAYRILKSKWILKTEIDFVAAINIKGIDRLGLMNKVTQIISKQMNVNIKAINITSNDGIFEGIITLKVRNVSFLKELTTKLKKIKAITSITRTYKHS